METEEDAVAARHRMAQWVRERLKCIYCLRYTERVAVSVGLPLCCDEHLQEYERGVRSEHLGDVQSRLTHTQRLYDYIDTQYLNAHNQEGLYRAVEELTPLYDTVINNAVEARLFLAQYRAYEFEAQHRLPHPDQKVLLTEILYAIGRITRGLEENAAATEALAERIQAELKQMPVMYM